MGFLNCALCILTASGLKLTGFDFLAENLDFLTLRNFAAGVKALIWH
jgi:hypothetical protein